MNLFNYSYKTELLNILLIYILIVLSQFSVLRGLQEFKIYTEVIEQDILEVRYLTS